jgi:hypothetical protein
MPGYKGGGVNERKGWNNNKELSGVGEVVVDTVLTLSPNIHNRAALHAIFLMLHRLCTNGRVKRIINAIRGMAIGTSWVLSQFPTDRHPQLSPRLYDWGEWIK